MGLPPAPDPTKFEPIFTLWLLTVIGLIVVIGLALAAYIIW